MSPCLSATQFGARDACLLLTRPRDSAEPGLDQRLRVCQQQDGGQRPARGAGGHFWWVDGGAQRICCMSFVTGAVFNGAVVLIAVASEQASHLPLQMLLYFNGFYFPCWWLSTVFMLDVKVSSWTQLKNKTLHTN